MPDLLLSDEARAYVGQLRPVRREGVVLAREIRKYCSGIRDLNPIYLDHDAAVAAGYRGIVCPMLMVGAVNRPIPLPDEMLEDGQLADLAIGPLKHLATMNGGQTWESFAPVIAGDVLQVQEETKIVDLYEREARSGPLAFQIMETEYTVNGQLVQRAGVTLILRKNSMVDSVGEGAAEGSLPALEPGAFAIYRTPSPVDMFGYCGAWWTTHRIHYDAEWARSEGFRGAVVVGPMQASYIETLLTTGLDAPATLERLTARFRAPVAVGDALRIEAWKRSQEGPVAELEVRVMRQDGVTTALGDARIRYDA